MTPSAVLVRLLPSLLVALLAAGCDAAGPIAGDVSRVVHVRAGRIGETRIVVHDGGRAARPLPLDVVTEGVRRARRVDPATGDSVLWLPTPTDATAFGVGTVRWSPDGTHIAAVVNSGADQSEVVVLAADGTGGRTASPELQYVASVAWSPDGRRIAYTMTTSAPGVLRLFVTDLRTFTVTSVAPETPLEYISELAWDARGEGVFFTVPVADDEGRGVRQAVRHVTLSTGAVRTVTAPLDGFVNDVAARGDRMLVTRGEADGPHGLYEVDLGGAARPLVTDLQVAYARYAAAGRGRHLLVFAGDDTVVRGYRLDRGTGALTPLPGLDHWASADLFVE